MSITWGLVHLAPFAVPPIVLLASSIIGSASSAAQRAAWMRATPKDDARVRHHGPDRSRQAAAIPTQR